MYGRGYGACALVLGLHVVCLSEAARQHAASDYAGPAQGPSSPCEEIMKNASKRISAWRRKRTCKCPDGQHVGGWGSACERHHGRRYFPDTLPPAAGCFCEVPRFATDDDVRDAEEYLEGSIWSNFQGIFDALGTSVLDWGGFAELGEDMGRQAGFAGTLLDSFLRNAGGNFLFPHFNFVQGMKPIGGFAGAWHGVKQFFSGRKEKWRPPVAGETMGVVTYGEYAREHFNLSLPGFFDLYYTGSRVPSWEDNSNHKQGMKMLDSGYASGRHILGKEPMEMIREMEPRFAFDNKGLIRATWSGFSWFGPYDIKYASNGVYGVSVVEKLLDRYNTQDTLGVLMTDSVFSAHLTHTAEDGAFHLDLGALQKYAPLPGYAAMGGGARFSFQGGRLKTEELRFGGKTYKPTDDYYDDSNVNFRASKLSGWRYAEKAVIASLLGMTNLVLHVKDLHLELAAAFQATTVDAFAASPTNPVRRLLDPFVHRSVQATNDNFKLLFKYKAAEFSLAPLPYDEQLRLIDDAIKENPLVLANMDMERYGALHGMDPAFSQKEAQRDDGVWFWRWHYRALTVQRLYDKMIGCWLDKNYGPGEAGAKALAADELVQGWWRSMIEHIPALSRSVEQFPDWAGGAGATPATLRHVLRTLFVWLSWVHEDVGHSAAAYVYNPVHTPMCVPEDGEGVPLKAFVFNAAAYRGFVFLDRAKLLDSPPDFWFGPGGDSECFADFQSSLRLLGEADVAFRECDERGFYSCVSRVETAVSS